MGRKLLLLIGIAILLLCGGIVHAQQDYAVTAIDTVQDNNDNEENTKPIYDSSERFFNKKEYIDEPFLSNQVIPTCSLTESVDSLKKAEAYWYINAFPALKKEWQHQQNKQQKAAWWYYLIPDAIGIIWWLIIIIFIAAVMYFLVSNKIGFFSFKDKLKNEEIDIEALGENIHSWPYALLISKALSEKNYRVAIRLLYLQTLAGLSEKEIIQFRPDTTNIQYLMQVRNTGYYDAFFKVTRHYEYVWYGKFEVSEKIYATISNDFTTILTQINSSHA